MPSALLAWYRRGHRDLPWRRTSDPYRVWVSEIMLQQTRAQAVIPYFERFLERFPTVERAGRGARRTMLWRCGAAWAITRGRATCCARRGRSPRRALSRAITRRIRALPGVGDYTAAAIASIAFGLPHAAVDGNVLRVVARVENDAADIGSARTRERFRAIAQEWLRRAQPGDFNQALMELGATVCLPKNPRCPACPLESRCAAPGGRHGRAPSREAAPGRRRSASKALCW